MFVMTLMAGKLTDEVVRKRRSTGSTQAMMSGPHWLDVGDAADTSFRAAGQRAELEDDHGAFCRRQPQDDRTKRMIIADGLTMITVECIDELADYAGLKPAIAASPNARCAAG